MEGKLKRLLIFLFLAILVPSVAWPAMYGNNIASSAFFVDTSSGVTKLNLAQNRGRKIKVVDTSGRVAYGYIGPAGTAETLGANFITEWTNVGAYPFETFISFGTSSVAAIDTDASGRTITNNISGVTGALMKFEELLFSLNSGGSATHPRFILNANTAGSAGANTFYAGPMTTGAVGYYGNWLPLGLFVHAGIITNANVNFSLFDSSLKQVLTPSPSGCSIYNSPALATNSWASVDSGFNWNSIREYQIGQPLTLRDWDEGMVRHRWRRIKP